MRSPPPENPPTDRVRSNVVIHDLVADHYDEHHGEIFNDVEQERLNSTLRAAIAMVRTGAVPLRALDFGCGSGNVTRHLLDLGLEVVAADVSEGMLAQVQRKFAARRVTTRRLNGVDLAEHPWESFDFVTAYSVLHHVPDYLGAVREFARVCKPGGVIYLDHEPSERYWADFHTYEQFRARASRFDWRKYLVWSNYVHKVRRWFDPRHTNEGDIHVWPDDHVEWPKIQTVLGAQCEVALAEDYLLFKRQYYRDIYEKHRAELADTRVMCFRKLGGASQ